MIYQFLQPIFSRPYHTPLREATRKGHTKIVDMLIETGAKVTLLYCLHYFLDDLQIRVLLPIFVLLPESARPVDFKSLSRARC